MDNRNCRSVEKPDHDSCDASNGIQSEVDDALGRDTPSQDEVEQQNVPLAESDDKNDEDEDKIYVPRKYDVLLGRGRPLQDHPGNLRFHKIINRARAAYMKSRKDGKAGIAREVLDEIKISRKKIESDGNQPSGDDEDGDEVSSPSSGGEPGRFLKKVGDANTSNENMYWVEVSQEVAIEKISHALRGRPRSETSNRNDGSGATKGSGSTGAAKTRRKPSKTNISSDNASSGGKSKRKGPPSPPKSETAGSNKDVNISHAETIPQNSSISDVMFTTNNNTPTHVPTLQNISSGLTLPTSNNTISQSPFFPLGNQLQTLLAAQLQSQAALQFQQQNAQQVVQQQLVQQLLQQQHVTNAAGSGTATIGEQTQQPILNTGDVGQLLAQQQQLQLLLQQQQILQHFQQQAQQLQLQPQIAQLQQSQQHQVQSAHQVSQQTQVMQPSSYQQSQETTASSSIGNAVASNATASGSTAVDANLANATAAILSTAAATGDFSAIYNNQNIIEALIRGASAILVAQQAQTAPNQTTQNLQPVASQTSSGQIAGISAPQLQHHQPQQSQGLLPAVLYPQQPTLQGLLSNLNPPLAQTPQEQSQPAQSAKNPPDDNLSSPKNS